MEKVFFVPGQPWVLDYAVERTDGVIVSEQQGKTLSEIQERHPTALIVDYQVAVEQIESGCKTDPRRIDIEDFEYALNSLPPQQWQGGAEYETFKMSERTNGRVTAVYARIGSSYWMFRDVHTISHVEIVMKIKAAQQQIGHM